jgi:hypothetical protein
MRVILLLSCFVLLQKAMCAQVLNTSWAIGFGGVNSESIKSVVSDTDGYVYTVGYFQGVIDVDPSSSLFLLSSFGQQDIFITKVSASGQLIWAKQIGGAGNESGNSICIHASGNIIITGFYHGMVDFDPGIGIHTLIAASSFSQDIFILTLNTNGSFQWAKTIGGSGYLDVFGNLHDAVSHGYSITSNTNGDILVTGSFLGSIDFDPGATNYILSAPNTPHIFILKLNANGSFVWAKKFGNNKYGDEAYAIKTDSNNHIYAVGVFYDSLDADPNTGNYWLCADSTQGGFVLCLTSQGDFLWANKLGGNMPNAVCIASCMSIAKNQDIFIGGYFKGVVQFNSGAICTSNGSNDIFIVKLNNSGSFQWVKSFGGLSADYCYSIDVDLQSNIYIGGSFRQYVDFDPGLDTMMLNAFSPNESDAFIAKLNTQGVFQWAYRIGGSENDVANAVLIGLDNSISCAGSFGNYVSYNASGNGLLAVGSQDAFLMKLVQNQISLPLQIIDFYGYSLVHKNRIQWQIEDIILCAKMELEKSLDAKEFYLLNDISLSTVTKEGSKFIFDDEDVSSKINYYRLKLIGFAGQIQYSKTVQIVKENSQLAVQLFPNPASTQICIANNQGQQNWKVKVLDINGKLIAYINELHKDKVYMDATILKAGFYFVELEIGSQIMMHKLQIVK